MKKNKTICCLLCKEASKKMLRSLRLTLILFLMVGVHQTYAQGILETKVSVKVENATLEQVIKELQKQVDFQFLFNKKEVKNVVNINLDLKNATIKTVLTEALKSYELGFEVVDGAIVIVPAPKSSKVVASQPIAITGTVKDEKKTPLPGATVRIKGSHKGTVTDVEGRFDLEVQKGDVLLVSYIGYESCEEKVSLTTEVFNIIMKEKEMTIGEVVVTGYRTVDKRKSTSAVTSIKVEEIIQPGLTSVDQMLEGHVPDMVFMSSSGEVGVVPKLRIRGTSTLIGNREPLWVVDGIIVQDPVPISPEELNNPDYINRIGNAISGINPQDIERLDVLKDAAATAIYGAKAANGVIVITTKKGRVGKPVINYSFSTSYKRRPRYTDQKIDLMNSKERIQFSKDLVENGYVYPSGINLVGYEGALYALNNGEYSFSQFLQEVERMETVNTDWFDLLTEDSFSQQHTISVSGGSEKVRYYASLGYVNDNDVIKGNNNNRYTAMVNLNVALTDKISFSFGMNGNVSTREYVQDEIAPMDYAYNTSRAIPAFDEEDNYYYYLNSGGTANSFKYNILNEINNSSYKQEGGGVSLNATLNYKINDWLKASTVASYSYASTNIESVWNEESHHVSLLRLSEYGVAAPKGESEGSGSLLPFGGELTQNTNVNNSYMFRLQLDANKYFGASEQHNISATVGYEMNSSKYLGSSSVNRGYYEDRGKQFASISLDDYPLYKQWVEGNQPTITDNLTNLLSTYATVSYTYKRYFTFNANMRIDGSNRFGDRSNEKLLPIWSVSGNYNIAEHLNMNKDYFDFLIFKASYGFQGNMLEDQSPTMIIRKETMNTLYNELTATLATYPNPNLRWEKTRSFNLGVDMSLFQRKLQVELSGYLKKTKDAFMQKTISTVNGIDEYIINSGSIKNWGYSVAVTAIPVRTEDFQWTLATSFSKIFNEQESKPGTDQFELDDFLNGTALVEGEPVGTFYSYRFIGLSPFDGSPLFDDWKERSEELEYQSKYDVYTKVLTASGNREPSISGNLSNVFRYKNWRLNVNLTYSLGAKVRLFKLFDGDWSSFAPENNVSRDFLNRWQKPGDELLTNIPGITRSSLTSHYSSSNDNIPTIASTIYQMYNYSDIRVVSGDYLKLSNVSVSYNLPEAWLKKIGFSRLELSFSATNLFTFCSSKLKGQTPTQSGFTTVQLSERPTFTFGINLSL